MLEFKLNSNFETTQDKLSFLLLFGSLDRTFLLCDTRLIFLSMQMILSNFIRMLCFYTSAFI